MNHSDTWGLPVSTEDVLTSVAPINLVTAEFGLVYRTVDLPRGNQRRKLGEDDIDKQSAVIPPPLYLVDIDEVVEAPTVVRGDHPRRGTSARLEPMVITLEGDILHHGPYFRASRDMPPIRQYLWHVLISPGVPWLTLTLLESWYSSCDGTNIQGVLISHWNMGTFSPCISWMWYPLLIRSWW